MEILNSSFGSLRLGNNGVISPDLETNAKMYNALEPALQDIQKAISLPEHERTQHNAVIHEVLDIITKELKAVDKLFKNIYQKTLYGGSYYDGLKLNSADEYDIDLALKLPKETNPFLKASDIAGFVQIHVDLESLKKNPKYDEFRAMERLVDAHNNLLTEQFRDWFEGVLNKAKNNLTKNGSKYKFVLCKSGPAFTLKLHINNKLVSVDLVPSLIFGAEKWPGSPFRGNVTRNTEFLVVPKTPVGSSRYNISWRLSFQEQEKLIINGKCGLKDTIRLLKLLRNHQMQETSFPSYYLKTVMMWMSECVNEAFWKNSRSYIFMMGLKYFCTLLENGKLPYYWNAEYNLLSGKKAITLENWSKRMNKIFKNLEKCNNKADVLKNFGLEKLLLKVGEEQNQTNMSETTKSMDVGDVDHNQNEVEVTNLIEENSAKAIEDVNENLIKKICVKSLHACTTNTKVVKEETPNFKSSHEREVSLWRDSTENEVFGVFVIKKLDKMVETQAIYAQSLITEILRKGLLNELKAETNIRDVE